MVLEAVVHVEHGSVESGVVGQRADNSDARKASHAAICVELPAY